MALTITKSRLRHSRHPQPTAYKPTHLLHHHFSSLALHPPTVPTTTHPPLACTTLLFLKEDTVTKAKKEFVPLKLSRVLGPVGNLCGQVAVEYEPRLFRLNQIWIGGQNVPSVRSSLDLLGLCLALVGVLLTARNEPKWVNLASLVDWAVALSVFEMSSGSVGWGSGPAQAVPVGTRGGSGRHESDPRCVPANKTLSCTPEEQKEHVAQQQRWPNTAALLCKYVRVVLCTLKVGPWHLLFLRRRNANGTVWYGRSTRSKRSG